MRSFAIVLTVVAIAAAIVPAQAQEYYFEYGATLRQYDPTWPPDGDQWHELEPNFCAYSQQTDHDDADGNGNIDVCEHIWFEGERHHVEWIGPTYRLRAMDPGRPPMLDKFVEESPTRGRQFAYHEVYPIFCNIIETTEPITNECQEVWIEYPPEDVGWWHVEEINTNIRTVPDPVNPVKDSTWGRIKGFFKNLF